VIEKMLEAGVTKHRFTVEEFRKMMGGSSDL
jgi:hypothetical protein